MQRQLHFGLSPQAMAFIAEDARQDLRGVEALFDL